MTVRILVGDCREKLKELADESVHCVCCSPPYFGLRDYGTAKWDGGDPACNHKASNFDRDERADRGNVMERTTPFRSECGRCGARRVDSQIGLEPTPDAYVAEMVAVFREVRRVLRKDGVVFLNLGDSYFTPGGRGGSFRGGVRRAIACDTGGKAPEDYRASDCFCRNLCDACRAAYRIGKSHSDHSRDPTLLFSSSASNLVHKGLLHDHLPTSDLIRQGDRSAIANPDLEQGAVREGEPPLVSPVSTSIESSLPHRGGSRPSDSLSSCQLCGCSLRDCAQESVDRTACTCGIVERSGALSPNMSGKSFSDWAYGDFTTTFLKPKDLIGIPWRVAFALQADGWWLRQDIIWSKPNPMPESVTDRCTKAHEYLFLLTKAERYYFDAAAIAEDAIRAGDIPGGGRAATNAAEPRAAFIRPENSIKPIAETRNKRSVWTVTTQPFSEAHFATFPPALIEPCILAGCPAKACAKCGAPYVREVERGPEKEGIERGKHASAMRANLQGPQRSANGGLGTRDTITLGFSPSCSCDAGTVPGTVLDCFGGAGTTGLVADRLQRNAILIELNPDYASMARRRISGDAPLFAEAAE